MSKKRMAMGEEGPDCSRIIAGFWRLRHWGISRNQLTDFVHECIDMGVTTFDHADIYGDYTCEQLFGDAVAGNNGLRGKMQLVTKCGIRLQNSETRPGISHQHYNTDYDYIIASAERSLKLLGTDRIDVLLIHRPDALMNADETARAFQQLKKDGKVLHFGVSNFTPSQVSLLQSRLPFQLVTNQIECSVLRIDPLHDGTLDQSQQMRMNPMAWSPLGGGSLFTGDGEKEKRLRNELAAIGDETGGYGIDQVALAWLLCHPSGIFPVVGSGKLARIQDAVASLGIALSREQWYRIWSASTGTPVP
ncbi:aldo/keto reductase [Natronogracilivirga saccharolytica]|uniref:Aldo/keto reductase n=1 Tax=Natronogracilivirga saccharolytica TaxID=2812953 RepID=A0A8J7RLM9_9BACT|nr:aldo/keto reductase [Natronogracilivirga saccharolytica]MBP3193140.1 aldo/keto reductase [Natronogracilivirga saccharolytica]